MMEVVTETGPSAPPGWYDDGAGSLRWWDGSQWGPASPPQPDDSIGEPRTWAMLSHLGLLMLYFVGPLVIRQTIGKRDDFVRQHATEALNAPITFGILWNLSALLAWGLTAATDNGKWQFLFAGMGLAFVWILTGSIIGARAAWRGDAWRYPGAIRFVPGGGPTTGVRLPE